METFQFALSRFQDDQVAELQEEYSLLEAERKRQVQEFAETKKRESDQCYESDLRCVAQLEQLHRAPDASKASLMENIQQMFETRKREETDQIVEGERQVCEKLDAKLKEKKESYSKWCATEQAKQRPEQLAKFQQYVADETLRMEEDHERAVQAARRDFSQRQSRAETAINTSRDALLARVSSVPPESMPAAIRAYFEEQESERRRQGLVQCVEYEKTLATDMASRSANIRDQIITMSQTCVEASRTSAEQVRQLEKTKQTAQRDHDLHMARLFQELKLKLPLPSIEEGKIEDGKDLPITFVLEEDFASFTQADADQFKSDVCRLLKIRPESFEIVSIQAGSVKINAVVHDRADQASAQQNTHACLKELGDLAVRRVLIGSFGLPLDKDVDLNPPFHKEYGMGRNMVRWEGALRDRTNRGDKPYYCPMGWKRFAIKVAGAETAEAFDAKYNGWYVGYHGTKGRFASSILRTGFRAHSVGCFRQGDEKSVYLSPSINYCAHPRYAEPWEHNGKWVQMVFQCRIHPAAITRECSETLLDPTHKDVRIDANIPNDQLTWVLISNAGIINNDRVVCYGIMIRECDVHPVKRPDSAWWKSVTDGMKASYVNHI